MSQADFNVIGTLTRTNWVIEANACWQALASTNSGATAPTTTYPYMYWADTAQNALKQRDATNSTWIILGPLFPKAVDPATNSFRLSVTSGNPFGTGTGATILYFTPVTGNQLALYDATFGLWRAYELSEQSITLSCTSGKVYDVFAYDNGSGSVVFEQLVWTNVNTRATALVRQDGVWVKSGALNRRYLGSYYATGTNTTEMSSQNALVFNASNRQLFNLFHKYTGGNYSWSVGGNTTRQMGGLTTNKLTVLLGLPNTPVKAQTCVFTGVGVASQFYAFSWGVDSSTTPHANASSGGVYFVNVFVSASPDLSVNDLPVGYRELIPQESTGGGSASLTVSAGLAFSGSVLT